ncbi:MAG: peptide ABC transporter substrate-binding protein [Gammaproteobacteria bacterium]
MNRRFLLPRGFLPGLVLALGLALGVAGCGDSGELDSDGVLVQMSSDDGVIIRRGNGGEPDSLDPHRSEETSAADILRDLFEGLTSENPDGSVAPGGAERWEISEDGRTYTFYLRADGRWSNGDPVVAEDFVAGLRRSVDPATGSVYGQLLQSIEGALDVVAGRLPPEALAVKAISDRVVEIRLVEPTPYFLEILNHSTAYPIHRASHEKLGDQFARPGNLVSNGAYELVEWVVQSHVKLRKNPYYWDADNAAIDTVYYVHIESPAAELKRYRAGELDFTFTLPNNQYQWIRENLPEELVVGPYASVYYYQFSLSNPPFDDIRLRQALTMAIDRTIMVEKVTGVGEIAAYSFVPTAVSGYTAARFPWMDWPEEQRLAEARRLYAEAGFSKDNPLDVELFYNTSENHKKIALAISAMWKQALGVRARLMNLEFKVMLEQRRDNSRWQVMRMGWVGDYNDPNTFLEIFHSTHGQNDPGFDNPEFDRLLAEASGTLDPARRAELLQAAEALMLSEYPVMPIYFSVIKRIVKPWVIGYQTNGLDHNYSKFLSIDTEARGF